MPCLTMVNYAEPVGHSVPEELLPELRRGFTDAEKKQVHAVSHITLADVGNERPIALFVCGPSGVGKSSVISSEVRRLVGSEHNAVLIDGAVFRELHGGWLAVRNEGLSRLPPAIHKEAWDIFKHTKVSEKLKQELFEKAVSQRQHLVIPDVVTNLDRVRKRIQRLQDEGYDVHIVGLFASEEKVRQRGEPRSMMEGKTFSTRGYPDSLRNTMMLLREGEAMSVGVRTYDNSEELEEVPVCDFEQMCGDCGVTSPAGEEGLARFDSVSTTFTELSRRESVVSFIASSDELDCTFSSLGISQAGLPPDVQAACGLPCSPQKHPATSPPPPPPP